MTTHRLFARFGCQMYRWQLGLAVPALAFALGLLPVFSPVVR